MPVPARPSNHASSSTFETVIPSLKEAYEQPIPLELRNRQDAAYAVSDCCHVRFFETTIFRTEKLSMTTRFGIFGKISEQWSMKSRKIWNGM